MTKSSKIPNAELRRKTFQNLQEVSRKLDFLGLEMDELLAMAEAEIRRQRRERLEGKYKR